MTFKLLLLLFFVIVIASAVYMYSSARDKLNNNYDSTDLKIQIYFKPENFQSKPDLDIIAFYNFSEDTLGNNLGSYKLYTQITYEGKLGLLVHPRHEKIIVIESDADFVGLKCIFKSEYLEFIIREYKN